jgi:lysophospholipase
MTENKYKLNTEAQLDNNYSPDINFFWDNFAETHTFESEHGGTINTVHIKTGQANAVVISQGRNESVFKYKELAYDLYKQGYDIFLIDHRGQGLSTRLGGDAHRGHVEKFDHYIVDFTFFVNSLQLATHYQSRFLLSHSMGGAISALYLEKQQHPFFAAAFFSPMFSINLGGISNAVAKIITYISDLIYKWFSSTPCYAPKSGAYNSTKFENNLFTHSSKRYASAFQNFEKVIETQLGGPTMHWLNESLYATEEAIANAEMITIPVILIQSGADRIVTHTGQQLFYLNLKECNENRLIKIADAKHEILLEQDNYRTPALTAALDFFEKHQNRKMRCTK